MAANALIDQPEHAQAGTRLLIPRGGRASPVPYEKYIVMPGSDDALGSNRRMWTDWNLQEQLKPTSPVLGRPPASLSSILNK